ncbi:uncharacterized protein LOC132710797 [Pantherophis guttatus]|uniref:Uncharacterized protein LOC132710797 n=1 Tax=Pantherophis guttatus TaxID=94885 RepID=A0ABM3Z6G9_PANGU|nr:uncharacterized protein LOC132710797 [Pantherophis guttatus]
MRKCKNGKPQNRTAECPLRPLASAAASAPGGSPSGQPCQPLHGSPEAVRGEKRERPRTPVASTPNLLHGYSYSSSNSAPGLSGFFLCGADRPGPCCLRCVPTPTEESLERGAPGAAHSRKTAARSRHPPFPLRRKKAQTPTPPRADRETGAFNEFSRATAHPEISCTPGREQAGVGDGGGALSSLSLGRMRPRIPAIAVALGEKGDKASFGCPRGALRVCVFRVDWSRRLSSLLRPPAPTL